MNTNKTDKDVGGKCNMNRLGKEVVIGSEQWKVCSTC
jgi:hypothetical protein